MTLELDGLYQDLIFYLGAMEYCARMTQAGVSLCLPQILPMEHRGFPGCGYGQSRTCSPEKDRKTRPQ